MQIDWDNLEKVLVSRFALARTSLHCFEHWRKVKNIGISLAQENTADLEVVILFALFHDSCRVSDGDEDVDHGARGVELAKELQGKLFSISDTQLQLLSEACSGHTKGMLSDDITIGTCWDADRLDLGRVGVTPRPYFLSTEAGHRFLEKHI